ncbi:hypothetical protein GT360_17360 [Vibrio astriarenae]|uniref:Uncharacterized protein YhfZ C-terminal domain-containing protein n=1 Tax=Vibrio astriarenae TaxID=1481923 RepID=A0A7Z2YFB2_9VIBR|nr:YhfZ family protein [Vibrio astriarenae]QIA65313.1 hypothetical protein GT360_17360 [Vibrio astriarenae]
MPKISKNAGEDQAILNAKKQVAIHALNVGINGKLPTNSYFKEQHNIVAGTMQRALNLLSESDALSTRSKGHLGRIVTDIDVGLCWNIAKLKPIQLLMPSSGSIEIDCLIKHVTTKLSQLNIPYFIHNQPGALERIRQVEAGNSDITLVSKGACEHPTLTAPTGSVKILEPNTYYCLKRLVIVSKIDTNAKDWKTVGIDRQSTDHTDFTLCEFPSGHAHQYIETDFRQVPARVLRGEIDAGIWHITGSPVPLYFAGLQATEVTQVTTRSKHQAISAAAFITNPKRPELSSLLNELRSEEVALAQSRAFESEDPYNKAF